MGTHYLPTLRRRAIEDGSSASTCPLGFGGDRHISQTAHDTEETHMGKKKKLIGRLEKEVGRLQSELERAEKDAKKRLK